MIKISILLLILKFTVALHFDSLTPEKTSTFSGNSVNSYFGFSVSSAGDINGDGYEDVIIGAYMASSYQGAVYVIYGGKMASFSDIDFSKMALDPATTGFTILGDLTKSGFGYSVNRAGDIDNDGYDDLIIGALYGSTKKGGAYVIYGRKTEDFSDINLSSTTLDPATTGFTVTGNASGDWQSYVSSAGDVNGDGYDDIIFSGPYNNGRKGGAYVIYGGAKSTLSDIDLSSSTLDPATTGFTIIGNKAGDWLGNSASSAGDIDNDGYDDMIIASYGANGYAGTVHVIYGREKSDFTNIDFATQTLDPATTGFTVTIDGSDYVFLGFAVASGDINGDGYPDVIIGASASNNYQGEVYVIYGGIRSSFSSSNLYLGDPAKTGFSITGNAEIDRFGRALSTGDVNGDGYDDIIVGASSKNNFQGAAYVVYGRKHPVNIDLSITSLDPATTGFTILGNVTLGNLGISVGGADVNNDGYTDLIVGAYEEKSYKGSTYLLMYNKQCHDNCAKCKFPSQCETCNQGFGLVDSKCITCPSNCNSCSSSTSCDICSSGFQLVDSECITCPSNCERCSNSTSCDVCSSEFQLVDSECITCPSNCEKCRSSKICAICTNGYMLSEEFSCLDQTKSKGGEKVASGAFEGTSLLGASLSSGSSLPLNFGLVSKILRNTKYLDITVSTDLQETFISWKVASGFLSAPGGWSEKTGETKTLPLVFNRYGLNSAFLINFWKPFIMSIIGLVIFVIFKGVEVVFQKEKKLYSISRQINIAASNFALTQFYSNLDDIFFYFILDIKSTKFDNGFQILSCILAIILLIIGGILIGLHVLVLFRYQRQKESKSPLDTFQSNNENISLFFKDFKDITFSTQAFLLVNVIRSMISSVLFATLFAYPLLQVLLLFCLNIGMVIFISMKKSFKELINTIGQIFCEAILLIANIIVFILAIFDEIESNSMENIELLSKCIIVLNFILLFGSAVLLVLGLGKMFIISYKEKKKSSKKSLPDKVFNSVKFNRSMSGKKSTQNRSGFDQNNLKVISLDNSNMIMVKNGQDISLNYERNDQTISNSFLHKSQIEESFEQSRSNIIFQQSQVDDFGDTSQPNLFSNYMKQQQFTRQRGKSMQTPGIFRTYANSNFQGPEIKAPGPFFQSNIEKTQEMGESSFNLDSVGGSTLNGISNGDPQSFIKQRRIRKKEEMVLARMRK